MDTLTPIPYPRPCSYGKGGRDAHDEEELYFHCELSGPGPGWGGHHLTLLHLPLPDSPCFSSVQFSHSVMSNSETPWTAAHQASLPITNSQSLLKLMCIESVMPSNHLILCCPLLLLPSIFPSIRVF